MSDSRTLATEPELQTDDVEAERWHRARMLDLPSTNHLREDLMRTEERIRSGGPRAAQVLDRDRRWAEYRLGLGEERDAIAATRPDGCWCLGVGGRQPSGIPLPGYEATSLIVYMPTCSCPEGLEEGERQRAAWLAYRSWQRDARLERIFGAPELRRYREARLDTVIVDPMNADAWDVLQAWVDPHSESCDLSLLIWGPVGTGKTYAAVALMRERMERCSEGVLFLDAGDFMAQIKATFGRAADGSDGPTSEMVTQAPRTVPLLVLDDLGTYLTPWVEEQLRGLVNARDRAHLPTLFTTNLSLVELKQAGERTYSRIVGMCGGLDGNIVEWAGPDRRVG